MVWQSIKALHSLWLSEGLRLRERFKLHMFPFVSQSLGYGLFGCKLDPQLGHDCLMLCMQSRSDTKVHCKPLQEFPAHAWRKSALIGVATLASNIHHGVSWARLRPQYSKERCTLRFIALHVESRRNRGKVLLNVVAHAP